MAMMLRMVENDSRLAILEVRMALKDLRMAMMLRIV